MNIQTIAQSTLSRYLVRVTFTILVALATCTGQEQEPQDKQVISGVTNSARLYVYRYKQYVGKAIRPSIHCDGQDIARIQNGRYVELVFAPGTHEFWSSDGQARVNLGMKAASTYYIRVELATGMFKGHGRLVLVQSEQGVAEVKNLKPIDKDMIKDPSFVPKDFLTR